MTKEQTDEYKLDKNHVFKVTKFDDFEKYSKVPDQYVAPEKKPYQSKVRGPQAVRCWLVDPLRPVNVTTPFSRAWCLGGRIFSSFSMAAVQGLLLASFSVARVTEEKKR